MSANTQAPTPVKRYSVLFPTGQHSISDGDGTGPSTSSPLEVFRHTDRGRPSSLILSCSLTTIPRSDALLRKLGIPIAISLSPLASPCNLQAVGLQSTSIPLLKTAPIRCQRCRGYMSPYSSLLNESWTCALCLRVNTYPINRIPVLSFNTQTNSFVPVIPQDYDPTSSEPLPYAEFFHATVEYDVSTDLTFLPATTDVAAAFFSELSPGEVSHVQSSILSLDSVMEANTIQLATEQPMSSSITTQNIFEGNDISIPSTECLYSRRLPILNADELIENAVSNSSKGAVRLLRSVDPVCLPFPILVLIPVTINSINSGVLASSYSTLLHAVNVIDPHISVIPLFYNKRIFCFRRIDCDVSHLEEIELATDILTSEPVLPYPLKELAFSRDSTAEELLSQRLLSHLYNQAKVSVATGSDHYMTSSMISAVFGCVSTLQRMSGKVIVIQTDPVTRGIGVNPLPSINLKEYSNPSMEKLYLSRTILINRLAYTASSHNIGIDIIALPVDRSTNLGLMSLSSLCIMTGGSLLYNEPSAYADKHKTSMTGIGNADFVRNALLKLLTCRQGISATLSIRASEGLTVNMREVTGEAAASSLNSALTATGASTLWNNARDFLVTTVGRKPKENSSTNAAAIARTPPPDPFSLVFGTYKARPSIENATQLIDLGTKPRYKPTNDDHFYANYFKISDVEYSFSCISEYNSYVMELKYDTKLPAGCKNSYVQTALLYTNTDGSRRIRVSTLQLSVQDNPSEIYAGVHQVAYVSWIAKRLAFLALNSSSIVTGKADILGGRLLLEKPVSEGNLSLEINGEILKYGNIVLGSATFEDGDIMASKQQGVLSSVTSSLPVMQDVLGQPISSVADKMGLQIKRKAIDEGVRTGHISANSAEYLFSKYAKILMTSQTALNIAPSIFLFDGEYVYDAILNGQKRLEQMVYPPIKHFRDITAGVTSDRLIVPNNLDTVPAYFLGLSRTALCHTHRAENEGGLFTSDMRCATAFQILSGSLSNVLSTLYPVIYNVTTYLTSFCPEVNAYKIAHPEVTFTMPISLPCPVRACSRYMENMTSSIFYLVSANMSFLWVGSLISKDIRRGLFGKDAHNEMTVDPLSSYAPIAEHKGMYSTILNFTTIVKRLLDCCGTDIVIPEGAGGLEGLVRWLLVEDSTSQDQSYMNFLNGFAITMKTMS